MSDECECKFYMRWNRSDCLGKVPLIFANTYLKLEVKILNARSHLSLMCHLYILHLSVFSTSSFQNRDLCAAITVIT